MRLILGTFAAIGVALAAPAAAQSVGMQVVDTVGAPVGTITAVQGDNLRLKTDKHEVLVPKSSFTASNGKLLFGMTQAQLDAQVESAAAASAKAVVAGATVNGTGGASVGKIEAVDNGNVTIALTSGKRIQLPANAVRGNADGTVTIGYTADQLDALVSSAQGTGSTGK
jgi:preprotein translocase subunit YajC